MSNRTLNVYIFRDASSPLRFGYGDPEYAGLIVLLIQEERENNARVGPLHPERARQGHQNSNREQCLFDARTIQEIVPCISRFLARCFGL